MREKSIRYRAPEQLRQRSRREARNHLRERRCRYAIAVWQRRLPAPNRKAAGRHRAAGRQPTTKRPASPAPKRAGIRAQRRPERSLREGTDEKTTEPSPKETAPNKFDMRYSVNAFRIPTRRRPQASTRASPDRSDSRSSAQRSSRRPPRRQAPAACAPRR